MGRCVVCGKSGLFFRVNAFKRCDDCEAKYQADQKAKREAELAKQRIIDSMKRMDPALSPEECYLAHHIISVINEKRPEYNAAVAETLMYHKIFIPTNYSNDYVVSRIKYTGTQKWFSVNAIGIRSKIKDDPLFADAQDKRKNHWKVPLQNWLDVKKYDAYFIEIADYLWVTYEIAQNREDVSSSILRADGTGISLRFPIDK